MGSFPQVRPCDALEDLEISLKICAEASSKGNFGSPGQVRIAAGFLMPVGEGRS